jgi:hypothetical protein
MYGFPETHLFCEETLGAWLERAARAPWPMSDGLLRAVAELYFTGQNAAAIQQAHQWLHARSSLRTDRVFHQLSQAVYPAIPVDKSPSTTDNMRNLRRAYSCFPQVRFIHLVRHPRGYCESVLGLIEEKARHQPIPPTHWLLKFSVADLPADYTRYMRQHVALDPQNHWLKRNKLIGEFLSSVPAGRQMRVRGEDLIARPAETLRNIASWLGLRTDIFAVDSMQHPERSPYAFLGPPGARLGNDGHFLRNPSLAPRALTDEDPEGQLTRRKGGQRLSPEVKALAQRYGYS